MDFIRNFPLFMIILSLFSGALCFMLPRKASFVYTVCFECLLTAMAAALLVFTSQTGSSFTYTMGEFPAPWGNEIRAGITESVFALGFVFILLCSVTGGYRYLNGDMDPTKVNLFFALVNLLTAALLSLVFTNDIFTGYVFLEILTLASCGTVVVREIGKTTLAAIRYMILNLLGSGLFLLGVVLLYDITGNLLMEPMHDVITEIVSESGVIPSLSIAVAILTIGLSIKSGLFPFHYWMPDTYGFSTPSAAAILSSLTSKGYIFLLIKIYCRVIGLDTLRQMPVCDVLLSLGLLGIAVGSVQAMHTNNINTMIAFSSAAQIGYIFAGIGLCTEDGMIAALFHILAHAMTKSMLFITVPRLSEAAGGAKVFRDLQGSGIRDKDAGVAFAIGAFSMIGIPIFAGFASKLLFGIAAIDSGSNFKLTMIMLALAVSSMLNAIYFIRTLIRIFTPAGDTGLMEHPRHHAGFLIPVALLTAVNLFLGLFSGVVTELITRGLAMFP